MPRPAPGKRADYRIFSQHPTRWADNDTYGHLNNVVHYQIFDSAVNQWLIGQGLLDPKHGDQIGLVVESQCRYMAEIRFPDVVTAGLRIAHLGSSSVRYELGLFRNDAEKAAAEGHFIHVYVDAATRRPRPIGKDMRAALLALMPAPS